MTKAKTSPSNLTESANDRLHKWMRRTFPLAGRCEYCARRGRTEYASVGHVYTRWRHDWFELCRRCHKRFDGQFGDGHYNKQKTHCIHGHPYDETNTYLRPDGKRECRICSRVVHREYKRARRLRQG